jgi:hypothetical protein
MEIICLGLQSSPFLQDLSSNCDDTIAQNDSKIQAEQHILAKLDVQANVFTCNLEENFLKVISTTRIHCCLVQKTYHVLQI